MAEARVIKRYANRKLYDTQHSRYVTLEQISGMIRAGDDVKIIDNKSKEDLTTVTLAQIIFEEEKKQRSFMPLATMRNIIQNGGEWIAEAQRKVQSILPGKRNADGDPMQAPTDEHEAAPVVEADSEHDGGGGITAPKKREGIAALREWVDSSKTTLEEWQKRVDGRIRTAIGGAIGGALGGALDNVSPYTSLDKDVKVLTERLAELEAKLERLAADGHGG